MDAGTIALGPSPEPFFPTLGFLHRARIAGPAEPVWRTHYVGVTGVGNGKFSNRGLRGRQE